MLQLTLLVFQNLGRNPLRTVLTMLGTMMLVMVVTLIWSILSYLDDQMAEKSNNFKAIISEKWRAPSQMPFAYSQGLREAGAREPGDIRPLDSMSWSFYGGSLDPKRSRENMLFAFCMEPEKLLTMMDELDDLPPAEQAAFTAVVEKLKRNRQGIILGLDRLKAIKKQVGERIVLYGLNYKDIDLELEIVGTFPDGRYNNNAVVDIDYLMTSLDAYKRNHRNTPHPLESKSLNLVWLRLPDMAAFQKASEQITRNPSFSNPTVKVETLASGIGAALEGYRDLIWGMRVVLAPAIMATLAMVIANAISISVRERQREFAVMKVLGFQPNHLLLMVLGESIVLGSLAGFSSAGLTYLVVNKLFGGVPFPIAFFGRFFIPAAALAWGPAIGTATAFLGSFVPAWSARSVRVSDVFARVT
ncbi:MAG: ABC transporter permease [Planctomycetia bacterium]|nr:ABC transporter permease [Planctomycetia bacterium]